MDTPVAHIWCEYTHVEELGDADFDSRSISLGCYDPQGHVRQIGAALADAWGISVSEALDRAIRLHLAVTIDQHDELTGMRENYEVVYLIPPTAEKAREIHCDIEIDLHDEDVKPSVTIHVPKTVFDMVNELTYWGIIDTKSEFVHAAVRNAAGIETDDDY